MENLPQKPDWAKSPAPRPAWMEDPEDLPTPAEEGPAHLPPLSGAPNPSTPPPPQKQSAPREESPSCHPLSEQSSPEAEPSPKQPIPAGQGSSLPPPPDSHAYSKLQSEVDSSPVPSSPTPSLSPKKPPAQPPHAITVVPSQPVNPATSGTPSTSPPRPRFRPRFIWYGLLAVGLTVLLSNFWDRYSFAVASYPTITLTPLTPPKKPRKSPPSPPTPPLPSPSQNPSIPENLIVADTEYAQAVCTATSAIYYPVGETQENYTRKIEIREEPGLPPDVISGIIATLPPGSFNPPVSYGDISFSSFLTSPSPTVAEWSFLAAAPYKGLSRVLKYSIKASSADSTSARSFVLSNVTQELQMKILDAAKSPLP